MGLVQVELPACEQVAIAAVGLPGYVALEAGPVEGDRLTYHFDVGRLER